MDQAQVNDIARVSVFALKSPITALEWADLTQAAPTNASSATLLRLLFELPSVKAANGVLSSSTLTELFYLSVFKRPATPNEIATINSIAPTAVSDRALWLADLITDFNAPDVATLNARLDYLSAVDRATTSLRLKAHEVKLSAYTGALLNWAADPQLSEAAAQAIESGLSWSNVANILLETSAGRATYASELKTFSAQLAAQLLSRAATAEELSAIENLGISDRGQLASVLIDFFQNYRGGVAEYSNVTKSLAQKTAVGLAIQASLPTLKVNAEFSLTDQGFAASQALVRGLSTPSVDRATASRFLSQVAEAPDIKAAALAVSGQGKAIDGYLAGSTVFVDLNGNGKLDTNEPQTKTDDRGNYQLDGQVATVVVLGGTDTASGKPFEGVLKAPAGSSVVTPLTTLVSSLQASGQSLGAAKALVAKAIGLDQVTGSEFLLSLDPIDALTTNKDPAIAATALKLAAGAANINNLIAITGNLIQAAAGGSTRLSDVDAANAVNASLSKALAAQPSTDTKPIAFGSAAALGSLLSAVTSEAAKLLPSSVGSAVSQASQSLSNAVAPVLASTANLIETSTVQNANAPALALTQVLQVQNAVQGTISEKLSAAVQGGTLALVASGLNPETVQTEVVSAKVTAVNPSLPNDQALIKDSGAQGTPPPTTAVSGIRISQDTGALATDFITSQATQTITATLSEPLKAFERVQGSVDGGSTWSTLPASSIAGVVISWPSVNLVSGTQAIAFRVIAGVETGPIARQSYTLTESKLTASLSEIKLSADTGVIATDYLTNQVSQTLSAKLSKPLSVGESVFGSVDGGKTFTELTATVSGTNLRWSTSLIEGSQSIQFQIRDLAGNQGPTATQAYTLDTAAPSVAWSSLTLSADTGSSPSDLITKTPQQVISVRFTSPLETNARLLGSIDDGANFQDLTSQLNGQTLSWSTTLAGSSNLRFQIRDAAGNIGSSQPQPYRIDTEPPSILNVQASWGDLLNSVEDDISGSVSALLSGAESGQLAQLTINSKSYSGIVTADSTVSFLVPAADLQALSQGVAYDITVNVTDAAGNSASSKATSFKVDRISPSIGTVNLSFGDRLNIQETNTPATISFSTALLEDGRPVNILIQSVPPSATPIFSTSATVSSNRVSASIPASVLSSLSDGGTFSISASATNTAGNQATSDSATRFSVDRTAPRIIAVSPSWGAFLSEAEEKATTSQFAIQTSGLEDGQRVTLVLNGQGASGTVASNSLSITLNLSTLNLTQGQAYTPVVSAQDLAGNSVSVNDLGGFRVDRLLPSIVNVTPSWGVSLNAQEVLTDKTIAVSTSQLEDGQAVSLRISGKDYNNSFQAVAMDNRATLTIPSAELAKLLDTESYRIQVSASRVSGNSSSVKDDTAFMVDRTVPVIESVALDWGNVLNAQEATQSRSITVKTVGVEAGLPVSIRLGDSSLTASVQASGLATIALPASLWSQAQFPNASIQKVVVSVSDAAGNPSLTKEQSFTVDRRLPLISNITTSWGAALNAAEALGTTQQINASLTNAANDSVASLTVRGTSASMGLSKSGLVNNGIVAFSLSPEEIKQLPEGSLDIIITVRDRATDNDSGQVFAKSFIDRVVPTIVSATSSWGEVLNDQEDEVTQSIAIVTSGVEDGQRVSLTLGAKRYESSAITSNKANVSITAADLQLLLDLKNYSLEVSVSDASGNLSQTLTTGGFSVNRERPTIVSVTPTWGDVLDAFEANQQASVTVRTANVENDQLVGIQLRGQIYTGKVTGDQAVVSIPTAAWQGVSEGSILTLAVNVNNKAGNSAATNTSSRFSVDRQAPSVGVHAGEFPVLDYQGYTVIVRMSEPLDENRPPPSGWFSVAQGGKGLTIKSLKIFADPRWKLYGTSPYGSIELTLDQAIDPYATLSIRYTDPNPALNDQNALQDLVGNDASSFVINNQPSQITASFSMSRAGVLAVYSIPGNASLDPIAAYDLFMPANGQRGVGYASTPLTNSNNVKSLLGSDKPIDTSWRVAGLASSLGAGDLLDIRTQPKEIATLIYDRIETPLVNLPFGLIAYATSSTVEIGSRVALLDGRGTLKLVEPATYQVSFKPSDPGVYVSGAGKIGTTGSDDLSGDASAEIFLTFSGDDTVRAGAGADGIVAGSGAKTIVQNSGDSGLFFEALKSVKDPWTSISTQSFDLVSGFGLRGETTSKRDQLDLPDKDYRYVNPPNQPFKPGWQLSDGDYTIIRGDFDPLLERFDVSNDGPSSMLVVDYGERTEAIILVGFAGSFTDDGMLGLLTAIPPSV